jgi:hypothetical protein
MSIGQAKSGLNKDTCPRNAPNDSRSNNDGPYMLKAILPLHTGIVR